MSLNTPPSSAAGLIRAIIKPSLSYKKRHWGKHFLQAGSNLRTLLEQKDEVQYGSRAKTRKDAERALSGLRNSLRGLSINSPFETTSYLELRSTFSDESARIDQVAEPRS
ncbi:hypothetical protein GHK78_10245 [Sinorhizobium meliloti]|nr:hypothetical protein [Sinorhizobium meliloti]MDW9835954.1 hypothetical protein [Sinorhizobium meliloti]MDX0040357.1 hypothetical protein [Sinorhizobium meliloti]MDX0088879.1 hypothetical protein [Sinorhizobium meliloti]MQX63419.1 hypothetical protein [Sinorhizobium meliloti]